MNIEKEGCGTMTILNIAYYTLIRNLRDVKSMANMILMPVILILILGNALSSQFNIQDIGKTSIAYIDNDNSIASDSFEHFLKQDNISQMLNVHNVSGFEEGLKLLNNKKVSAIVMFDEGLSEKVHLGQKAEIKIYDDINNQFRSSIVKNLVESYVNGANTQLAMLNMGSGAAVGYRHEDKITEVPLSAKGKIPSAMDYYAVTMLVLIVLYGSLYALHGVSEDYLEGMGNRLRAAPVPLSIHFAGKILGTIATIFLQTIALIIFTKYVYRANWGDKPIEIIFIAFTFSVFSVSLGLVVAMVSKDKRIGTAIIQTLIPIITFISGGYARIISDNPLYSSVKLLMPSNLAYTAFFHSIYGDFAGQTVSSVMILWIMTAFLFGAAVMAGRRKIA